MKEAILQYLGETYAYYFYYVLAGYLAIFLIIILIAWLFISEKSLGNPASTMIDSWIYTLSVHFIMTFFFLSITWRGMSIEGRTSLEMLLYNLGFVVCLCINSVVIFSVWKTKRELVL